MFTAHCTNATHLPNGWTLRSVPFVSILLLLVGAQVLIAWIGLKDPLMFAAAVLFLIVVAISFTNTLAGLVIIILLQLRMLTQSIEVSADELAYGALFVVTLAGWAVRDAQTSEGRHALASPVGRAIMLFLALAVASIVPALLHGTSIVWWFRDLVRFSSLILFFPIATVARSSRKAGILWGAFLAVVVFFAVYALATYNTMLSISTFASEMQWQRAPVNEVLPMVTLVGGATFFFLAKTRRDALIAIALSLVSLLALAVSLSRGFWAAGLIAIVTAAVVSRTRLSRVAGFALVMMVAALVGAYTVFGWRLVGVLMSLAGRFSSMSSPLSELTIRERLVEVTAQLRLIRLNPIIGHGLGASFSYMSPISHYAKETMFSHNAYVFLAFKLGIVGLLSYLALYFRGMRRVRQAIGAASSTWTRAVLVAGFGVLVSFLPLSITSPQFFSKNAALVIVLLLGFAEAVVSERSKDPALENRS